jgi:hypothetical protein
MRFAVASSVLASTVAAATKDESTTTTIPMTKEFYDNILNKNNYDDESDINDNIHHRRQRRLERQGQRRRLFHDNGIDSGSLSFFPLLAQTTPFGSKPISTLKNPISFHQHGGNSRRKNTTDATSSFEECDPTTTSPEGGPDIGVLSCGHGKYCMESTKSSLGGYCAAAVEDEEQSHQSQQRLLQVVGNRTVIELVYQLCYTDTFSYYTCDCSINVNTSTGTFSCVGQERCAYQYSGCSGDGGVRFQYCLNGTVDGQLDGPTSYSYKTW